MAEQHLVLKIKQIDQTQKPLVVLLKGSTDDSVMMEAIVRTSGLASLREQTTLFVLSTTEAEAMMMQAIRDALTKASLPQVRKTDLPMVMVIGRQGKALKVLRGLVTAGEVKQCLVDGVAAFQSEAQTSDPATSEDRPDNHKTAPLPAPEDTEGEVKGPLAPETPAVAPSTPGAAGPATDPSTVDGLVNSLPEAEQETDLNAPVQLQVYLPDGQAVRASFTGSTLLREVCSYIEQHSPEGTNPNYKIVSPHLRREFTEEDMSKSLHELGVASMTSLRLHETRTTGGSRESALGGLGVLSDVLQFLRRLVRGILNRFGFRRTQHRRSQNSTQNETASANQPETDLSQQQPKKQSLRKRHAQSGKVHGIDHTDTDEQDKRPDSNSYWNGNSTQFDGDE